MITIELNLLIENTFDGRGPRGKLARVGLIVIGTATSYNSLILLKDLLLLVQGKTTVKRNWHR